MVKDNKFAAEPTADSTADSKKDRNVTKVTTTDNVGERPQPKHESSKKPSDKEVYDAYVKGEIISDIADKHGMTTDEVMEVINKTEKQ